jgi:hypothetical protein
LGKGAKQGANISLQDVQIDNPSMPVKVIVRVKMAGVRERYDLVRNKSHATKPTPCTTKVGSKL